MHTLEELKWMAGQACPFSLNYLSLPIISPVHNRNTLMKNEHTKMNFTQKMYTTNIQIKKFRLNLNRVGFNQFAVWLSSKKVSSRVNPLPAELFNLNFHQLEVVSRWRDLQLQLSENYSDLTKWRSTVFKYCWLMSYCIFNMSKRWYLMF